LTRDTASAAEFYGKICRWSTEEADMGETGTYTLFKNDGKEVAGMMNMPPAAEGPDSWLLYVAIDDADAAARRIEALGGKLFVQPTDIPNVGRFAVAGDPCGATFAVFKSSRS
jgi:predicted enzyme related to lactoylglutathione lyase